MKLTPKIMETSSNNQYLILCEQENGSESPPSAIFNKFISSSPPKKSSRRSIHKRVVSVPLNLESNSNTPPSDSWAWRKYGQKPIKGSPYPRGYYRCSSSKGCPARKQVERSNVDPTMLVVTYSCEHNHPIPASRNSHHHHHHSGAGTKTGYQKVLADLEPESNADEKISDLASDEIVMEDEFSWFNVMETTTSTVLESQIFKGTTGASEDGADFAMFFPMKEEDESLFADLGELPECSAVFGPGVGGGGGRTFKGDAEQLPPALSPTVVWGNKLNSAATC